MKRVSILTVGDELQDGRVLNTNQHTIASLISDLNYLVVESTIVNDDIDRISSSIKRLASCSDILIITGGLGPTTDDLTIEALAKCVQQPLVQFNDAVTHVKEYYQKTNRLMPESNIKQTYFPKNSTMIPNERGTAPGCYVHFQDALVFTLPGVPSEMKKMLTDTVIPTTVQALGKAVDRFEFTLSTFGLGESAIQDRVSSLGLSEDVQFAYRVPYPVVMIKVSSPKPLDSMIRKKLLDSLSPHVFSTTNQSLNDFTFETLLASGKTLAFAESCTGGLATSLLVSISGASKVLKESVITYSNESKIRLGVSESTLDLYGAVSEHVALEMAEKVRSQANTDIGVGISGVAGPDGGTPEKPVGMVCIAIHAGKSQIVKTYYFSGHRKKIQTLAAYYALWMVSEMCYKAH